MVRLAPKVMTAHINGTNGSVEKTTVLYCKVVSDIGIRIYK